MRRVFQVLLKPRGDRLASRLLAHQPRHCSSEGEDHGNNRARLRDQHAGKQQAKAHPGDIF